MKNLLLCFFLFCMTFGLFSKEITLKIVDKDINIPLEGVKVVIKNNSSVLYTDSQGMVKLVIDDKESRVVVSAYLVGYSTVTKPINAGSREETIQMSITGVVEGKELVIEEERVSKSDEKIGVSTVINKEELKSTSEIGIIEDALSSLKFLPGVSFAGGFDRTISIRGGDSEEMTTVYDNFIIRYPFQWNTYSIFNPQVLKSIKYSFGIFNVKNGMAMSCLAEFESSKPDKGFHYKVNLSTSNTELFLEIPVGKTSGFLLGTRITYYDPILALYENAKKAIPGYNDGTSFSTYPYIRNAYFKWFIKPGDRYEVFVNGLFAGDGIGVAFDQALNTTVAKSKINSTFDFKYHNYYAFANGGFNIYPVDKVLINFIAGYEFLSQGYNGFRSENGKKKYSQKFIDEFGVIYGITGTEFEIKDLRSNFQGETVTNNAQSRLDFDFKLHERVTLSTGTGFLLDFLTFAQSGKFYTITFDTGIPVYKKVNFNTGSDIDKDKQVLKSFLYLNLLVNVMPSIFDIEVGCRLDHSVFFLKRFSDGSLNTYPFPSPRILFTVYAPLKNIEVVRKLTFSTGTGIFTKMTESELSQAGMYNFKDGELPVPKLLSSVIGGEIEFGMDLKVKIEGYYKYYFNRSYLINKPSSVPGKSTINYHSDGIGHSAGFDIILQKSMSRFFDGWITYSFNFVRFYNPYNTSSKNITTMSGDPAGMWFYPSYHRFHVINLVLNIKPVNFFTFTILFSMGSGTPKKQYLDKQRFAAVLEDGTIAEMYTRQQVYSDELRTAFTTKLDLKADFNFYFNNSKIRFEAYLAVEDLLAAFIKNQGSIQTDQYTGKDTAAPDQGFSFPIPIPSFGIKINF